MRLATLVLHNKTLSIDQRRFLMARNEFSMNPEIKDPREPPNVAVVGVFFLIERTK